MTEAVTEPVTEPVIEPGSEPRSEPGSRARELPEAVSMPRTRGCPFDPPVAYEALTGSAPLHPLRFPMAGDGWLVTQHAAARSVLADSRFSHRNELVASPLPPPFPLPPGISAAPPAEPGAFNKMDPPEHTRYRRLVGAWFSARKAGELVPAIEEAARELLAGMAAQGSPADLVRCYARPLPARVIFDLLDVPAELRDPLQDNFDELMRLETTVETMIGSITVLGELLDELARSKMTARGGGLLGDVARRGGLDAVQVRNIAWALLGGGTDTTANMIGLGTVALLAHPDQLELVRHKPELLDNAVEETLRYLTISQFGASRAATEDVEVLGHRVRAGQTVVVALPAVNRDPRVFPEPDRLDVARQTRGHLAFGYGVHKCIGQYLARVTLRVAYAELFARFADLRLAVGVEELPMRHDMDHYGVHEVPVTW